MFYRRKNTTWQALACVWQAVHKPSRVQVPFESLKRTARDRKSIVEELNAISQKIANLGGSTDITREQACQQLQELSTRLEALQTEVRHMHSLKGPLQSWCVCLHLSIVRSAQGACQCWFSTCLYN